MISIKNLTKEFSGQKVLDGINFDIKKGEVVALVGASGAGKSTILRSLNYLEQPDSGTITIDDFKVDFKTITKEQILTLRRKLAMVFQQFNLFERRTALDNVKEGLKIQTMILVSHDMNFVYQVADKVLFLEKGHILEQGTPDEIFNHPKEERTKEFFASYSKQYL